MQLNLSFSLILQVWTNTELGKAEQQCPNFNTKLMQDIEMPSMQLALQISGNSWDTHERETSGWGECMRILFSGWVSWSTTMFLFCFITICQRFLRTNWKFQIFILSLSRSTTSSISSRGVVYVRIQTVSLRHMQLLNNHQRQSINPYAKRQAFE